MARFLALQWWRFAPDVLQPCRANDPARFADALEARICGRRRRRTSSRTPLLGEEILALATPA